MKRLSVVESEMLAQKFRTHLGVSMTEPICVKTVLRKLSVLTMYRPLSDGSYGISAKSESGRMFMMVNCNSTIGRQHFTVAHELYHLFYDDNPEPHMCGGVATGVEKDANLFASALLMPREGLLSMVSDEEVRKRKVSLATVLRMEQYFGVSRITLLLRLKDIGLISEQLLVELKAVPVKESAKQYGYDLSLYEAGNAGVVIGDFGEKARLLFESGRISEGHYYELMNMITNGGEGEDCSGC